MLIDPEGGWFFARRADKKLGEVATTGTYTAEFKLDERTTFLRWVKTMDGHRFESLEVIVGNERGLIVERTVALRPYPALKLFRDAMYASLKDKLPP
jgi:hypothetical protein